MDNKLSISNLTQDDLYGLTKAFNKVNWPKPISLFEGYLQDQLSRNRIIWVARIDHQYAGYITLLWQSHYKPFATNNIPEIMDLNVLPQFRNHGIGTRLLDMAEQEASLHCNIVGLGVGLYGGEDGGYGAAQRLYIKRGYIPDGRGVAYNYEPATPGKDFSIDDNLLLWFTKQLNNNNTTKLEVFSRRNAPYFTWGNGCEGWWLKKDGSFNVIEETMPSQTSEINHRHLQTEQFFICLDGILTIIIEKQVYSLQQYTGISVPAGIVHMVLNDSQQNVKFLVISCPNLANDRINLNEYPL